MANVMNYRAKTIFTLDRFAERMVDDPKYRHTPGKLVTFDGGHFGPDTPAQVVELPWRDNKRFVSCCTPGIYKLIRRAHEHCDRLRLLDVPDRDGIEIHIANDALDIEGCIGPGLVSSARGVLKSEPAMRKLLEDYDRAAAIGEVWIDVRNAA